MTLGEKLQQLRRERGISQEQLAAYINVSRQAVSKWELNESMPDTSNVIQLSGLFNVTTDYLLIEDAPRRTPSTPDDRHDSRGSGGFKLMEKIDGWEVVSMCMACVGALMMLLAFDGGTFGMLILGAAIDAVGLAFFNKLQKDKHRRWNWGLFIFGQLVLPIAAIIFIIGAFDFLNSWYMPQGLVSFIIHGIIGCGIAFLMWAVSHFARKPRRSHREETAYTTPAEAPDGYIRLQ